MILGYRELLMDGAATAGYSPSVAPFGWPSSASVKSVCKLCLPLAAGSSRWMHLGAGDLLTMTQELIEELRAWINYDPDTGTLTWKKHRPRSRAGSECGTTCHGYRVFHFNGKTHSSHRVAWALHYGAPPVDQIDHINHNKGDNRISNLRSATNSENNRNKKLRADNASGEVGVRWYPPSNKWVAQVVTRGKPLTKYFFSRPKAIEWAREKRAELHGEFAAKH